MKFSIQNDSDYGGSRDYVEIDQSDIAELFQLEYTCNKCYGVGKTHTIAKRKKIETICSVCNGKGKQFTVLGQQLVDFLTEQFQLYQDIRLSKTKICGKMSG